MFIKYHVAKALDMKKNIPEQTYFEALFSEWQRKSFGGAGFGRAVSREQFF